MNTENKDIRTINSFREIVECTNNQVYGDAPMQLIDFFNKLPASSFHDYLRTLTVPYLFHLFESNLFSNKDPRIWFKNELFGLIEHIENILKSPSFNLIMNSCMVEKGKGKLDEMEIKAYTGQHYGNLFKEFNHRSYFSEAKDLLEIRLKRNGINLPKLKELRLLDQGCGGGRYTVAWKLLGVKEAIGLDYSKIGLDDAKKRIEFAEIENVSFKHGTVLEMPFENNSFDIVFSNGVLHHTENWKVGISEQLRVLKSGGFGWLYLIEKPGGLFWDKIEILRAIMKNVEKSFARQILKSLNIPNNRIFYMLDHAMVPINTRSTPTEIENELKKNNATSIQRLKRGTDFDRIEHIHNNIPYAKEKFGVGENRYFFRKK